MKRARQIEIVASVIILALTIVLFNHINHLQNELNNLHGEKKTALIKVQQAESLTHSRCWAELNGNGYVVNCERPIPQPIFGNVR